MEDARQQQEMREAQDKAEAARKQMETEDSTAARDELMVEAERQEQVEDELKHR